MNYVVYDPNTGEILKTGICPPEALESVALFGEVAIEDPSGEARDNTHMVVDGVILPNQAV